jgi:hypothetical protein
MNHWRWQQALPSGLWLAVTLVVALPALAHHSFAAYDDTRTRTLKGTVMTFRWTNPHVALKVLVELDGGGEPQEWNFETSSPAILTRFGWTRNSIKPGDRVSVVCNPLSDGSLGGRLHTVVLLDTGQRLETKLSAPAEPRFE